MVLIFQLARRLVCLASVYLASVRLSDWFVLAELPVRTLFPV